MVEIHEATRLLVVLEQEPDQVLRVLELEPMLDQLVKNRWIMLMAYSPESNEMFYFDHTNAFQKFEEKMVGLQSVPSSLQWVLGKKGHLEFVRIGGWS
jgi:uncharacterized protein YbcC (UPF0753/DUF2309 family)